MSAVILTLSVQAQPPAPKALEPDSNLSDAEGYSWSIGAVGEGPVRHLEASGLNFLQVDSDGQAHMIFGGDGLHYARQQGKGWQVEAIETADGVGRGASLALDSQSRPVVSYCDDTSPALKLARWTGEYWDIEWVEALRECLSTAVALDAADYTHVVCAPMIPHDSRCRDPPCNP